MGYERLTSPERAAVSNFRSALRRAKFRARTDLGMAEQPLPRQAHYLGKRVKPRELIYSAIGLACVIGWCWWVLA